MAETNQPFEVGAIVLLKSGGPQMTVTALYGDGDVGTTWQHRDSFETSTARFPAACLRAVENG